MYLSKLRINGFKSFATKTELDFSKGVTCIIGPNGCGKSNIVDAIRWVIGEQKAGSLRSEKMTDVIFNGNTRRKPIGMAEVALTIINDKGILPSEYSEVELARRVYRDGQSEYLINNQVCRLKDIQELFMDTGMGSDAYSVIELKMVEQILSTNNSERRLLFEEAAGIKKYKQRRKSALRKLDDTEQNLLRIEDILSEVASTVRSLERQVDKANKYQTLKTRLKDLDMQAAAYNFKKLQAQLDPLISQVEESKHDQQDSSNQLSLDESLIEKFKLELIGAEQKLSEQRAKLFQHDEMIRQVHEEELLAQEKSKNKQSLVSRLTSEVAALRQRKIDADKLISEKRAELEGIQENSATLEEAYEFSERESLELTDALEKSRQQLREQTAALKEKQRDVTALNQQIDRLKFEAESLQKQLSELAAKPQVDLSAEKQKLSTLEAELERRLSAQREAAAALASQREEKTALAEKLKTKQAEKNDLEKQFLSLESKRNIIEETLLSGELLPETVQKFQEEAPDFSGYIGILSDLISIGGAASDALSTILQPYASLPVFAEITADELSKLGENFPNLRFFLIGKNKSKNADHPSSVLNFVSSESLTNDELASLLGDFLYVDKPSDFIEATKQNAIVLSPSGIYSALDKTVEMPSDRSDEFSLFNAKKQVEAFDRDLEKMQETLNTLEEELFDLEDKSTQLSEQIDAKAAQNHEYEIVTTQKSAETASLKELITREEEFASKREEERAKLAEHIKLIQAELAEKEPKFEELAHAEDELEQAISAKNKTIEEQTRQLAEKREAHFQNQIKFRDFQSAEGAIKDLLKREYYFLKEADDQIAAKEKEMSEISTDDTSIQSASASRQEEINKLNKIREELLGEKLRIEENYQSVKAKIDDTETGIKDTQRRREKELDRVQKLELKINELTIKSQTVSERIYHDYQLDIREIAVPQEFELLKSEQEIYSIKNKISALGEVNALAIEDYKKEKERHDFLEQQHNDLIDAKTMLVDTIATINKTAQEQFVTIFEQIRANFQIVFKQFFANGEADLAISEHDDPLDGQIEIKVSPKGRSLQTLALMSGGEKTLTAISLLFSIYLVKPSPFCILDEVDAPLDDVNISRFSAAIKSFTDRTQFFIITHNKRTMEASDFMYGVTQEESGISKLVSVNFTS